MIRMKKFNCGFTLIEVMITVSILAIVSTLALTSKINIFHKKNEVSEIQQVLAVMSEARDQAIKIRRDVTFHFHPENQKTHSPTHFYFDSHDFRFKNISTIKFDMLGRVKYEPSLKCIEVTHVDDSNYKMKLEITPLGEFALVESNQGCFA